jgi:hypothetical protein
MEAKLNNQTAMMLQLRDENLFLKERVRKGSDTVSPPSFLPSGPAPLSVLLT